VSSSSSTPHRARDDFDRFIGVSLGGGRGKTTAVARIEVREDRAELVLAEARVRGEHRGGGTSSTEGPFRDEVLVAWLRQWVHDRTVVAIDAPLTLPPCVRCDLPCPGVEACVVPTVVWMRKHGGALSRRSGRSDPKKPAITPYTQRMTELLLEHVTLQPREALGQGMGPLAARAAYLRRVLSPALRLHENLLEVHPRATLIRAVGHAAERATRRGETEATWEARKSVLRALSEGLTFERVWPEVVVRSVHVFDAVVAAFTATAWARRGWQGPESLRTASQASMARPRGEAQAEGGAAVEVTERGTGGTSARRSALDRALDDLGELWLEDGWIWAE